jgi:hypothetical protein
MFLSMVITYKVNDAQILRIPMRRFCGGYAQILRIGPDKPQGIGVACLAACFAVPRAPLDQARRFQIGKMPLNGAT